MSGRARRVRLRLAVVVSGALLLATCVALLPARLVAQGQDAGVEGPEQQMAGDQGPTGDEVGFGFGYRGSASLFGGGASGGTPIGTVQDVSFSSTFETGGDGAWGIRGTLPLWWRLAGELEFLSSSPGIEVVLTDLTAQDRARFPFAGLDMSYVAGSVRFDLANSWVNPFLQAGFAGVHFASDEQSTTSLGLLFGGGVEVPIPRGRGAFGRVDVRGLRADLSGVGLPPALLEDNDDVLGTQVIWSIGLGYRF